MTNRLTKYDVCYLMFQIFVFQRKFFLLFDIFTISNASFESPLNYSPYQHAIWTLFLNGSVYKFAGSLPEVEEIAT